ncbi:MAG: hypothetical protein AAEF23_02630 [Gammaproteobacteria bacterium]
MVKAELNGVRDPVSLMLKGAKSISEREGRDLHSNLAGNSAVALRLLMERGNIPNLDKDVMSGAVFHNCDWPEKWNRDSSTEVALAQDNWFQIENKSGSRGFTSTVLQK